MKNLFHIQAWMQAVVTDPYSARHGVEGSGVSLHDLESIIAPSENLSGLDRLSIYNRGYHARLIDCLKTEYPCLHSALGDELFKQFAADYLQHYPSKSYTLNELGRHFPHYLEETSPNHSLTPSSPERQHWQDFIIDLATLERSYLEIYDAPGSENSPLINADELLGMNNEQFMDLSLKLTEALTVLRPRCRVDQYFQSYRQKREAAIPPPQECALIVFRRQYIVRILPATVAEAELLMALKTSGNIPEAINDTDLSQSEARSAILNWADQGMLI